MYKYIYFDLDGTIIDSSSGVVSCIKRSLSNHNLDNFDDDIIKQIIIGPPLYEGLQRLLDSDNKQLLDNLVQDFRDCYNQNGVYENVLYDGIKEVLKQLSSKSSLILLTSKPEKFAKIILEQHNILQYFMTIDGAGEKDKKSKKAQKLIQYTQINQGKSIMIGDRVEDILASQEAKIDSLAVTYGFDDNNLLAQYSPTYIVNTTQNILQILQG
jgi:phosphoglycolate phosphatase